MIEALIGPKREEKVVWVKVRVAVDVDPSGYPELAGRMAEIAAQNVITNTLSVPGVNKTSANNRVSGTTVTSVNVWDAQVEP